MEVPADGDLASAILAAGGVRAYLERAVYDGSTLRSVAALAAAGEAQAAQLRARRDAGAAALRDAAERAVHDVRLRLFDIEKAAAETLSEYDTRRARLAKYRDAFRERTEAAREHAAVTRSVAIARAYADAMRPLHALAKGAAPADRDALRGVSASVARLVKHVAALRVVTAAAPPDEAVRAVVTALEDKTVDAVVKARAAFVNVLDTELRAFGWPMKIPDPEEHSDLLHTVNLFVGALDELQTAAEQTDFVPPRTKWQAAVSDSWSIACLLRAPLARFRYHFLESHRAEQQHEQQTARFDRPEWAADFAMKRIEEAAGFLAAVQASGRVSAHTKFHAGFARVFADKIAYDAELAVRSSQNDSDADKLIAHAASTARKFDVRLREVVAAGNRGAEVDEVLLPSALSTLAANDSFFTGWASSELRLAEAQVGRRLEALLTDGSDFDEESLQRECTELLQIVGDAGAGSRNLNQQHLVHKFLRLTEVPLLQSVRARLRQPLESCEWQPGGSDVFVCTRVAWVAHVMAECLEDRALEPFYARLDVGEEEDESEGATSSLYGDEVSKMRRLSEQAASAVSDGVVHSFVRGLEEYSEQVLDATLPALDAAVVLAHDLSLSLCTPMETLSTALKTVVGAARSRLVAARVWRDVAARVDAHFFDEVVLRALTGACAMAMKPRHAAKMARQMAFDAHALVGVFDACTTAPATLLPRAHQAGTLLAAGAARVMRPNIAKLAHDEAVRALLATVDGGATNTAADAVRTVFGVDRLDVRECLELFAIAGMREAIPLS